MAFQRVPNTVEVRCITDYLASEYVTTFYARRLSPYGPGDVDTLHEAVGEAFRDFVMVELNAAFVFDRTEARDLNTEFGYSATIEYNTAGTQTGDPAPPQLAVLVKLTGDPGGAPRQGRIFYSGVNQSHYTVSTNLWSSSIVGNMVDATAEVRDAISAAGIGNSWAMVIVSRVNNKQIRAEAVTNTLQSITGRTLPGSQRDRRPTIGS